MATSTGSQTQDLKPGQRRSAWGFCMLRWLVPIVLQGLRSYHWLHHCRLPVPVDKYRITTAGPEFNIDSAMLGGFLRTVGGWIYRC